MNEPSQFGLIGIVFRHGNDEQPWTGSGQSEGTEERVSLQHQGRRAGQDRRNPGRHAPPPVRLDRDNEPVEVTVAVTLQASLCDLDNEVNTLDLRRSVSEAVENAVRHHEEVGFDHFLADIVSLGVVEVRTLNVE